jgi:division protein CdvB (Snf7/Vps24/ESCRT-III family)
MKVNNERQWEKHYNELRTCHNIIKILQNKNNCPFWFGEKEKMPKRYAELLLKVSDALYDAEAYTTKKL